MSVSHLTVVRTEEPDSPAARARKLLAEAQAAAMEQIEQLEMALDAVVSLSKSVAEGGDIYPAGVRELCRRTAEDTAGRRLTLEALAARRLDRQ
jgi:hypothetical protein